MSSHFFQCCRRRVEHNTILDFIDGITENGRIKNSSLELLMPATKINLCFYSTRLQIVEQDQRRNRLKLSVRGRFFHANNSNRSAQTLAARRGPVTSDLAWNNFAHHERVYHCLLINNRSQYKILSLWARLRSTVVRTTFLSKGNMHFSDPHKTKIPWPIKMKLCKTDYVNEMTKRA